MNKIKVGLAGCGSVAGYYLPNLRESPFVELISVCDVVRARAERRAAENDVPHTFVHIDEMLDGPKFDLLINTTAMQAHYPLNKKALIAGVHVFCEKPIATTLDQGKELLNLAKQKNLELWGAPNVVTSPQFRCMAEILQSGEVGQVYAAHACYGHAGPSWGPWFYKKGGGCLYDLGVYNVTTLTGLLGPAKAVVSLSGTAIPERQIEGEAVKVEADDNTMLLIDHGSCVYSHIQTGFTYRVQNEDRSIELIGTKGAMNLLGFDWAPGGVQVWTESQSVWKTLCTEQGGYQWQSGGGYVAACLATGVQSLMTGEHAFHVLEVMQGTLKSAETGQRVAIESTFAWPIDFRRF